MSATGLVVGYGGAPVLDGVDVAIPHGRVTALIGPNGCGKSTLLRALGRQLRPSAGGAFIDGDDVGAVSARAFARRVSFLPQQPVVPESVTVRELIGFGRYPFTGAFAALSADDHRAVEAAAVRVGVGELLDEQATALSGGQRQRAWIAMTVAQEATTLLLDEPTTYLDPAHQLATLELVRGLNAEGRTVAMVLHDMTQAARFADHVIAMSDGGIVAEGDAERVLTRDLVRDVFGVDCLMVRDPDSGRELPIPHGPVGGTGADYR
ncbi:ABC transporter ATP-binding protein [uncultured Corynebacterium sp.]|uniref:ABC transporter ATP-binding protein n=1 Tax=uncultured Corynebacterium sp. TaxID=159447 RepID=UPI0025F36B7E|nr:ABC transporter ATP-binding protein [uncultured Corynebacterium sp.]